MIPTILYVDDEEKNLYLFRVLFECNYTILTSLGAENALQLIKEERNIDVIFSDLDMPDINGVEFIREVKKTKPEIPCCLITAFSITDEINKLIENHTIEYFLRKPFNSSQINNHIKTMMKNQVKNK